MADESAANRLKYPPIDSSEALARAKAAQAETVRVAERVARTEEALAATFDKLAEVQPQHAARLRAKSQAAREQAAYDRQWIKDHSA